ncbi:MAG: YIP1 family protein [Paracoccaceae bacterium]|nr:YIP1 family protein [Paracoccaceae bacterium]
MTLQGFINLAWQSIVAPREVAALLLSIRPSREVLLTAFALVVVLNALVFAASVMVTPPSSGPTPALGDPMIFMVFMAFSLVAMMLALTWAGRGLGGTGRIEEVALLIIWLQALRVLVQTGLLVLLPVSEFLSAIVVMAASALGLWILLNFLAEVHDLDGLGKAALVLVFGVLGMALGLTLILSLLGITPYGIPSNV